MIAEGTDDIVFVGGKNYVPLFCHLTKDVKVKKVIFFNSLNTPQLPLGYMPIRYATTTRSNWHYECASDLIERRLAATGDTACS
jgi:hypothetical protein